MGVELLPSMCFAVPHHREPDGKQIWLASDGSLRCPHGEKSSTICYWLAEEKAARAKGKATPPRGQSGAVLSDPVRRFFSFLQRPMALQML